VGPGHFPLPEGRLYYRYRWLCAKTIYQSLVRMAFADSVYGKCRAFGAEKRFDIIECAECGAEGYYLKPAGKSRLVVRLHTPFSFAARLDHLSLGFFDLRKLERMERGIAERAHAVSSPTRALARVLERKWGLQNVHCYPNPMDTIAYAPKQGPGDYIIYTGRVEYRKGVHVLIKAYAELVKEGCALPLLLVGAPYGTLKKLFTYEQLIEELIKKLGLEKKVRWIRQASRDEVRDHLSRAAAAVYPSLWENFPYAGLEAMASGVPVVASQCGGYEEMIEHGKTGLLFPPLSSPGLAGCLKRVLNDPALSARLGAAGREKVASAYSADKVAETAEAFYTRVLE
jgi:glycosyltransferase involved in cell wall biosynthesis